MGLSEAHFQPMPAYGPPLQVARGSRSGMWSRLRLDARLKLRQTVMMPENEIAKDAVREAYEDPATLARYTQDSGLWKSEGLLIERYFPAGGHILDLGCGSGRTSFPMVSLGLQVVGVDQSDGMLRLARERAIEARVAISWLRMDAATLGFRDAEFDGALFSFNGMDHMPGVRGKLAVLRQVVRVLKPGAAFIFSTHRTSSPYHWPVLLRAGVRLAAGKLLRRNTLEREWGEIYAPHATTHEGHYGHFMSSRQWVRTIEAAGFELATRELRSELEQSSLLRRIRKGIGRGNYEFFVARRPPAAKGEAPSLP
jgi:ubiquinone/menaquinone biosynthesis C-methylase UbiE